MAGLGIGEALLAGEALGGAAGLEAAAFAPELLAAESGIAGLGLDTLGGLGGLGGLEAGLGLGADAASTLSAADLVAIPPEIVAQGTAETIGGGVSAAGTQMASNAANAANAANVANAASINATTPAVTPTPSKGFISGLYDKWKNLDTGDKILYSGLGSLGVQLLRDDAKRYGVPGQQPYTGPLSKYQFDRTAYRPSSSYVPMYRAEGGIMGLREPAVMVGDPYTKMASGGISDLGSYSDGGRLLKDPNGDGMDDTVPATIEGMREARLSEGEFVVPADVVSDLGNGSTDAGAKQLYAMMDRVRMARHGTDKQGRQIDAPRLMAA